MKVATLGRGTVRVPLSFSFKKCPAAIAKAYPAGEEVNLSRRLPPPEEDLENTRLPPLERARRSSEAGERAPGYTAGISLRWRNSTALDSSGKPQTTTEPTGRTRANAGMGCLVCGRDWGGLRVGIGAGPPGGKGGRRVVVVGLSRRTDTWN